MDCADFEHRPHEELFDHYLVRQFVDGSETVEEGVKSDAGQPLGFVRFGLNRANPTQLQVWAHDNTDHNSGDVGLRIYQIIRYR